MKGWEWETMKSTNWSRVLSKTLELLTLRFLTCSLKSQFHMVMSAIPVLTHPLRTKLQQRGYVTWQNHTQITSRVKENKDGAKQSKSQLLAWKRHADCLGWLELLKATTAGRLKAFTRAFWLCYILLKQGSPTCKRPLEKTDLLCQALSSSRPFPPKAVVCGHFF